MALFLVVLGGAAVIEVHRAITGGSRDVEMLRKNEEMLRKQLQDIQRELMKTKEQRELSEQEASQLSAINSQLQQEREELSRRSESLQAENEELIQRADKLLERQQLLEQCAESLKLENSILIQQFDRLKLKYEQDNSQFQEKLTELKTNVSSVLQKFTQGDITADQLIKFLSDMGVELKCNTQDVEKIPKRLAIANTPDERSQALGDVQLKVDDNWIKQMQLATMEPSRAARLLMSGASTAPKEVPAITAGPAQPEQRRLTTPQKAREAQALKLTSHAVAHEEEDKDTIGAVHSVAALTAGFEENAKEATKDAKKGRALLFRPANAKKAAKKMLSLKGSPLMEMREVPLDAGSSVVPRLAFDAVAEDVASGPGNGTLMAL